MPIQTAIDSIGNNQGSPFGFKNRIINGGMVIDQRNAGASGTAVSYTVDRWYYAASQSSKGTWQQREAQNSSASNYESGSAPNGFKNSLKFTSSSAYTVGSSDYFEFYQAIEGYNISDLDWGSSTAKSVTLSFWVKCSLTGTFSGAIQSSGATRSYPFTYTISSANTWEQKTITIPGDTSGTWLTTNGVGIYLILNLGSGSNYTSAANTWVSGNYNFVSGSTSVVGTNAATWYVTGVQIEKGTQATSFDYRPYGYELHLCQRYYETTTVQSFVMGFTDSGNYGSNVNLKVTKRAQPGLITGSATSNRAGGGSFTLSYSTNSGVVDSIAVGTSTAATGGTAVVASGITVNVSAEL